MQDGAPPRGFLLTLCSVLVLLSPDPPQSQQSHDGATFGFVLPQVRGHGRQVGPAGHVRNPLVGTGGLAALDVFVVLVDAGQCGHVENVSDAVLRLLRRALDVGRRDLLGHAGTLGGGGEVKCGHGSEVRLAPD